MWSSTIPYTYLPDEIDGEPDNNKPLTKKEEKARQKKLIELMKSSRVLVTFNTGTRTHKSKKDYNRNWKMDRE